MDYIVESSIELVGTCNELNAGYAADAYARLNGVGAVCVTYGVGGLSLVNAIAGAYAEEVPLIVISGAPLTSAKGNKLLLHHTTGDYNLQRSILEKVTVAAVTITNPNQAAIQIDQTIAACLPIKSGFKAPSFTTDYLCYYSLSLATMITMLVYEMKLRGTENQYRSRGCCDSDG